MWQAACCAVCQASDRPVIRSTQHIHHRHFNNPTNEPPTRTIPASVLPSDGMQWLICWWCPYIKPVTFSQSSQCPLTANEEEQHVNMLWWASAIAQTDQQSKDGRKQKKRGEKEEGRWAMFRLSEQVRVKSFIHREHFTLEIVEQTCPRGKERGRKEIRGKERFGEWRREEERIGNERRSKERKRK